MVGLRWRDALRKRGEIGFGKSESQVKLDPSVTDRASQANSYLCLLPIELLHSFWLHFEAYEKSTPGATGAGIVR